MSQQYYSVIIGSGSYLPTRVSKNEDFIHHTFFDSEGKRLKKSNEEIVRKFSDITGIFERRQVTDDLVASDIGYFAAKEALSSSGVDGETLDYIIFAHNFGDIQADNRRSDIVPTLASRVKGKLGIQNANAVCYDLPFGCAGWLQGVIHANFYIKAGEAKRVLVIGAETLSRICDPHDRDSMLYADGAGAVVIEARASDVPIGVLAHNTITDAGEYTYVLRMERSCNPDYPGSDLFLKMNGRSLYELALKAVPKVMKKSLETAGVSITEINKVLIHQANRKMDEAIVKRLYEEYGVATLPEDIMPMVISWLGNSSVATIPILYDLINKGKFEPHHFHAGNNVLFAAMGAGVNINAMVYRVPEEP
jgi:3-oxoacyl-[acyl-carrier-protein] synthase-3